MRSRWIVSHRAEARSRTSASPAFIACCRAGNAPRPSALSDSVAAARSAGSAEPSFATSAVGSGSAAGAAASHRGEQDQRDDRHGQDSGPAQGMGMSWKSNGISIAVSTNP